MFIGLHFFGSSHLQFCFRRLIDNYDLFEDVDARNLRRSGLATCPSGTCNTHMSPHSTNHHCMMPPLLEISTLLAAKTTSQNRSQVNQLCTATQCHIQSLRRSHPIAYIKAMTCCTVDGEEIGRPSALMCWCLNNNFETFGNFWSRGSN